MVTTGGHYYLFFSGNDWDSANYAVGVAICIGPLGPCSDASPSPILSSGPGVAGPGGESVFADTSGNFWIAFHAWVPGAVGFPNSRDLYLRRLTFSATGATVATPGLGPARTPPALPPAGRSPVRPDRRTAARTSSVGPRQRNSSTSPSSERSIRNVASSLKRRASSRPWSKVVASLAALRTTTSQSPESAGISSTWLPAGQDGGGRLRPPTGQSGEPVRAVADQRQIVGDGGRADAELGGDATLVDQVSLRRSSCTTRVPRTHWPRSLSGVQMMTCSTSGSSAATAAPLARASSASSSTIGHTSDAKGTKCRLRAARPATTGRGRRPRPSCSRARGRCERTQ